jgi:4-diphosphocytidyl-2-C-methyl-D-erythritol kinase
VIVDAPRGVQICAPAKINLFLHAGDRREDGYHALESLVVFAQAGDRLSFAPDDDLTLSIDGPFAGALSSGEDNLVLRAARALGDGRGAMIALEKNLPPSSGLGGGSADAAATLRALNLLWDLQRGETELMQIAATLGSDVPACLLSAPCWMEGRGERVTKLKPFPPSTLVLVNPGIGVSTAEVFTGLNARTGLGLARPGPNMNSIWDIVHYLSDTENDLEAPACRIAPVIEEVLEDLSEAQGCVLARMSGSGATCFGLFESRHWALPAAEAIAYDHPEWWVRTTRIADASIGVPHWMAG